MSAHGTSMRRRARAMIGRIETEVERNGKTEYETRYYLCSLAMCALMFARAVRAH